MKGRLKQVLCAIIAVVMVMSFIPVNAISLKTNTPLVSLGANTATSGIGGDSELFDSQPALTLNKTTYEVGEPIYATATQGNWVGIYSTIKSDGNSIFWYYVSDYIGVPFNVKEGTYNSDNGFYSVSTALHAGSYKAVLFDESNIEIESVNFSITDTNGDTDDLDNYITTNKYEYAYGEPIYINAKSDNSAKEGDWIGVYESGADVKTASLRWYYLVTDSYNYQGSSVSLYGASQRLNGVSLDFGKKYDVYLLDAKSNIKAQTEICVSGGTVKSNKTEYDYGEDIIVTTETSNSLISQENAWVGLYNEDDVPGTDPSLAFYYLKNHTKSVNLDDILSSETPLTEALKPGTYCLYLFGGNGNGYDKQSYTSFTVSDRISAKFEKGAYKVNNLSDGFANGTVALKLTDDSIGYIGNVDVTAYWADADGNKLEGYTALAKTKINRNITTFDMYTHTIIPESAESLVAYVSYNKAVDSSVSERYGYVNEDKLGAEGLVIPLPTGTSAYTGLDDGVTSEFQMVSDLHITSKQSASVDGGKLIDQWYHENDNDHFVMMLEDIAENSPGSVGIFVNGDIANNGLKVEFDETTSLYNSVASSTGKTLPPMYVSLGNHDSYPGNINDFVTYANSLLEDDEQITASAPYYSKDINGYKYIFLAGDNPAYYGLYSANPNSNDAELSDAQLQWLDAELLDNEKNNDGKPVFVMLHQSIENTVAGSFEGQNWDGVVNVDELKAILNKYNNVILLGGHSHWEINSYKNLFAGSADLPVAVNTASVGYLWSDYNIPDDKEGVYLIGSQGFYVRTYEDKTVFLGRDFENQLWVPSACYVIYNEDVNASSLSLQVDDEKTVSEWLNNPKEREIVSFTTSDSNIVQIHENGTINAMAVGTATITVTALATDTEVVTREKVLVTVTNEAVSEEVAALIGEHLDVGSDFSAYIGYTNENGKEYYLTIPSDEIDETYNRNHDEYLLSQGFYNTYNTEVYYPEFIEKNNAVFSVRQFWDFVRQEDDGSYIIFNTWTNATHHKTDEKFAYALDGGSYSYYKETKPIEKNDVDNGLLATWYDFNDPQYTSLEAEGSFANYYRWYLYADANGNYYLKNKHTGYILRVNDYTYSHFFGKMDKLMDTEDMPSAALIFDRIAQPDNIKMSLFDYGKYINNNSYIAKEARKFRESGVSTFDANANDNILWFNQDSWKANYVVDGVATDNQDLMDSNDITVDNLGNPSQYDSRPLMLNSLDASGYPYVNNVTYHDWNREYGSFNKYPAFGSDSGSLKYLFDEDMTYVTGDDNTTLTAENYAKGYYQSVRYDVGDSYGSGMFKKASTGGLVYSSYMNAAYFDTSEFYESGVYQPVSGQRFQIYDYVMRPYYHYYYDENTSYTDAGTGKTYNGIYNELIKSTRLNTFGDDSLFNDRDFRRCLRDYNSYNRNFLPFNYGHNIQSKYIQGDYTTYTVSGTYVDPVYPDEFDTRDRTGYTQTQQDTPNLPAYYNDVYADTTGDVYTNSQKSNLWFGMSMEFDFEIQNNGQIFDENHQLQDMVFNFAGDDDVLVYIDNVLVLNVAGTHGVQMATINFATGNIAHPEDEACYPGHGIDYSESSTIKDKFVAAYAEANQEGSNSILAGTTLNEDMFDGNTFKNGTRHTLKFYYLERGGSRSFCDIYFNMETLPSSGFEVEKQSENAKGENVSADDNGEYTFIITGYTSEDEQLTSGTCTYDVIDTATNAVVGSNLTVEQGSTFTIKAGQKAVFKDLEVTTKYQVIEIVDKHYVKNVKGYLDGNEVGTMALTTGDDHIIQYMLQAYIPVKENETYNAKFVNIVNEVDVTLKYYNREVVSGKPADMGDEEHTFVHKIYSSDIIYTNENHEEYNIAAMILNAAGALESGEFGSVSNILEDYYVWTSQKEAVDNIQKIFNTHTGKYYEATEYHTDQYGNVQTSGEKWVDTVTEDDGTVLVTSWLFNRPHEYTVSVHGLQNSNDANSVLVPIDGTDKYAAAGITTIFNAYFNQRLGGQIDDIDNTGVNNDTNYLSNYGLPGVINNKAETISSVNFDNKELNFMYWSYDVKGKEVASTDIDYLYRVTGDLELYAIYGEGEPEKGVTVTKNKPDYYSVAGNDGKPVDYVKLNTIMSPYGYVDNYHVGGGFTNEGITDVAVVYINVNNAYLDADNLTETQLAELKAGVLSTLNSTSSAGVASKKLSVSASDTSEGDTVTLAANAFKYDVVSPSQAGNGSYEVYLTTKNRVQFTTKFTKAQLDKLRLLAFSAIQVTENGDTKWVISDNYIDYNLGNN